MEVPRKAVRAHNSWRLRGVRVVCQGEPLAERINTQASLWRRGSTGSTPRRASGEEDQRPGEPLAKRITRNNTQASLWRRGSTPALHPGEPSERSGVYCACTGKCRKLLQEAGAGEGERLFVCVIRSLRSLFPRVCARLARCARFFFWCA